MKPVATILKENLPTDMANFYVLLWDGDCGFCRRSVLWVSSQDQQKKIKTLPYQLALQWLPKEVRDLSEKQVHLLDPQGNFWGGAEAAIKVLEIIGYSSLSKVLALPGFSLATDLSYRLVASNRKLFSKVLFRR